MAKAGVTGVDTSVDVSAAVSPARAPGALPTRIEPAPAVRDRWRRRVHLSPVNVAVVCSAVLATVFLLLPPSGTDLAAAVAHGRFARQHPLTPVDLSWYGGTNEFGYSLISQYFIAGLGARVTGALAAAVASIGVGSLLGRLHGRRALLASAVASFCIFSNLISGRIAYAVGIAFGVLACCAVARRRTGWATAAAFLCAAASPVAGLFLGIIAACLWVSGHSRQVLALCGGLVVPMLVTAIVFGQGGHNTMSRMDTLHALAPLLAVLLLTTNRLVRTTTAALVAAVLLVFFVSNPVGLSVSRLGITFAIPVLLAFSSRRLLLLVPACLLVLQFSSPLSTRDLAYRGGVTADRAYFAPLLSELATRPLTGRVEIPPLFDYWEAAYVASDVPLARGWLRQLDTLRNPLFFRGRPVDAAEYQRWLADNAVQYVAIPADRMSWVGRREAQLVSVGLPYLERVWSTPQWTLYAVSQPTALVDPPAQVVSERPEAIVVRVGQSGRSELRLPWNRWLVVDGGGCLQQSAGRTVLSAPRAGSYRITSSLLAPFRGC